MVLSNVRVHILHFPFKRESYKIPLVSLEEVPQAGEFNDMFGR